MSVSVCVSIVQCVVAKLDADGHRDVAEGLVHIYTCIQHHTCTSCGLLSCKVACSDLVMYSARRMSA